MKNIKVIIIAIVILFINLGIRLYGAKNSPVNINWDEASLGYNAYSLMKTGKDEFGAKMPFNLRSFNDYKPALYAYLTIPFIKVFGLTPESLRMTSAVFGTLSLIPLLMIIQMFLGNWKKSFLWWSILSMGPMRIHFSRVAVESNLSMCFFSFGGWFLLKYLIAKKLRYFSWAIFSFVLAMASYHSARMAAPALLVLVLIDPINFFIGKKWKLSINWKTLLIGVGILGIFTLILFVNSGSGTLARFNQENIWTKFYPFTPRGLFVNSIQGWILSNPIYYLLGILVGHASAYLSPFDLVSNQFHWIRRSVMYVPGYNVMGLVEGIFFVLGILVVLKNLIKEKYRYVFYWFLAAIAPAVITWNWLHMLRVSNALLVFDLVVILGLAKLNKTLSFGVIVLMGMQFMYQFNNELVFSNYENYGEYQPGGFKEGIPIVADIMDNYDKVVVDSSQANPYIFFLFYLKYDPALYQDKNNVVEVRGEDGSIGYNFGKFEFRRINWAEDQHLKHTILWMKPGTTNNEIEAVEGARIAKTVIAPIKDYVSTVIVTLD